MIIEKECDLFEMPHGYYFAHSIATDCSFGAGIAKEFDERYCMREALNGYIDLLCGDYGITRADLDLLGTCILVGNVYNLFTKKCGRDKPSYSDVAAALSKLRKDAETMFVKKIAMPKICCGKDGLDWEIVRKMIDKVFDDSDIEIVICKR